MIFLCMQDPACDVRLMIERRWRRMHSGDCWVLLSVYKSESVCDITATYVTAVSGIHSESVAQRLLFSKLKERERGHRQNGPMEAAKGIFKDAVSQDTLSTKANPHFWEIFHSFYCYIWCAVSKFLFNLGLSWCSLHQETSYHLYCLHWLKRGKK